MLKIKNFYARWKQHGGWRTTLEVATIWLFALYVLGVSVYAIVSAYKFLSFFLAR
jgi:hypothetical protein